MRGAAERGHLVLGLGDFNMIPLSLAHRLISTHSPVKDVWSLLHPDSSVGAAIDAPEKARQRPVPSAQFNLTENGATCDSVLNTWRWEKDEQKKLGPGKPAIEIPLDTLDPKAKRLDYIFASTGYNETTPEKGGWAVKTAKVGMTERHPTLQCSLSDHFSVECTLVHTSSLTKQTISTTEESAPLSNTLSKQSTRSELEALNAQFKSPLQKHLPVSTYDEIIAMIHKYHARESKQRRWRLRHFVGWVCISIGCYIAVWWSPKNYVSFILMLLSSLGLAAGVIDGLIGGLFVGSEIRALKEFEWEISNARAAAIGVAHVMAAEGVKDW